jgi:hypothetical protein
MAGKRTKQAQRSALTVFSVDTPEQAEQAIVTHCTLRYDDSYRYTRWPKDIDPNDASMDSPAMRAMDEVTDTLRAWWQRQEPAG